MASSIHIEAVKTASFAHNDRTMKVSYLISSSEDNYCSCSSDEASQKFHELKSQASANYTARTKQRIQKKTVFLKEAIVNLEAHHTKEDLKPIIKKLEGYGFTVLQFAIHRDEGFKSLVDGEKKHNYHAHITMFNLDVSTGKSVKFGKNYRTALSQLQTFVANTLGMERGKISDKTHAKELQEEYNPKQSRRLGTHEYKAHAKKQEELKLELNKENYKVLAKQKDLKKEISDLRLELKENKATRPDYAKLEQLNKELKQQIKDKILTVDEFQDKIKSLEYSLLNSKKENKNLEGSNNKLDKTLILKEKEINSLVNQNKALISEKEILMKENLELKEKIDSRASMVDLKTDNAYEKIVNEHFENKDFKIGVFEKKKFIVVSGYSNFKKKMIDLISQGSEFVANKHQRLISKYNTLVNKFNSLLGKYKEIKKEKSYLEKEIIDLKKQLEKNSSNNQTINKKPKLSTRKELFEDLKNNTDELNKMVADLGLGNYEDIDLEESAKELREILNEEDEKKYFRRNRQ